MKNIILTIVNLSLTISLFCFPFYPRTTVILGRGYEFQYGPNYEFYNVEPLIRQKYDEDDLIMLIEESSDWRPYALFFNGEKVPPMDWGGYFYLGEPLLGYMEYHRFSTSPFYIKNIALNSYQISFELLIGTDYEHAEDIFIEYLIVEKSNDINNNNMVRYSSTDELFINQNMYSHTLESFSPPSTYKAVVIIKNAQGKVLQAASTDRVEKPLRIVIDSPLSKIISTADDLYRQTDFYIMNCHNTTISEPYIYMHGNTLPESWQVSIFDNDSEFTNNSRTYQIQPATYQQVSVLVNPTENEGYGSLGLYINDGPNYTGSINIYFTSDNLDVLVIEDDAGKGDRSEILNALSNTGKSYGFYYPHLGETEVSRMSDFSTIIWNVSIERFFFPVDKVDEFELLATTGTNFIIFGRYLAQYWWLCHENLAFPRRLPEVFGSSYYTFDYTRCFTGYDFLSEYEIDFGWLYFSSIIRPTEIGYILFSDPNNVIRGRGVYTDFFQGKTVYIAADMKDIEDSNIRRNMVESIFNWFDTVDEKDPLEILNPISLYIYPIPAKNMVNIEYKSSQLSFAMPKYSMYNIKGQKVCSGVLDKSKECFRKSINIDELNLATGIYFIKVEEGNNSKTSKVLVIK
ncbi:MAG: T9SS type A sorting domain-containing protein [Candidatus Cloacimonetes bacterium]|nr:T9SS type A sorting domain-containing protein [Candidatus Cloacimonadota bacterium]